MNVYIVYQRGTRASDRKVEKVFLTRKLAADYVIEHHMTGGLYKKGGIEESFVAQSYIHVYSVDEGEGA